MLVELMPRPWIHENPAYEKVSRESLGLILVKLSTPHLVAKL